MKLFSKKITGLFLIALLIIGLLPAASFAEVETNAKIFITADDAYRLYVNGNLIGKDWQEGTTDELKWKTVETYNVTLTDDFVIAIEAVDLFGSIAGVSATVEITGKPSFDISNSVWKVSTSANSEWKTEKFYAEGDNWKTITPVTPHQSWPSAGQWGWTDNPTSPITNQTTFFKYYVPMPVVPKGTVNVYHYLIDSTTSLGTVPPMTGAYTTDYQTSPLDLTTHTVKVPENAKGQFTANPIDVIYFYTLKPVPTETNPVPTETQPPTTIPAETQPPTTIPTELPTQVVQPTTEDDNDENTFLIYPTTEAATEATTVAQTEEVVIVVDEDVALGENVIVDFDAILPWEAPPVDPADGEVLLDEPTPLADALPQTGQLPGGLFVGLGGLISAAGLFLKRKG